MSLIYCPECGHEISTAAVACPSCGRPINTQPTAAPRIVVNREPKTDSIPPWVIAPVILLGAIVLFGLIYLFSSGDDANTNLSVNVNARRGETARAPERTVTTTDTVATSETTVPSSSMPVDTAPSASYPTSPQNVPGSSVSVPPPDKATVLINAKISTRNGSPQAVRNTRFYLLDKDIETILSDSDLEPIEGQTLSSSLALAFADQSRYGTFYRQAMSALKEHIKYTGSTDATGKAQLGSVKPDSYYLFGVARTGEGFAVWNSPVSVTTGENLMNLSPQTITQMPLATGEE
jgi:hypothetical protein